MQKRESRGKTNAEGIVCEAGRVFDSEAHETASEQLNE